MLPKKSAQTVEANARNIMLWGEAVLFEIDGGMAYFPMYVRSKPPLPLSQIISSMSMYGDKPSISSSHQTYPTDL